MRVARLLQNRFPAYPREPWSDRKPLIPYEPRTTNNEQQKSTGIFQCFFTRISGFLSSQGASPQVLSAFAGLTAVFGMGTGGSPQLSPLNCYVIQDSYPDNCIKMFFLNKLSARLRIVVLSVYLFPVSQFPEIRSKRFTQFCASSPTPSKLVLCLSQVLGLLVPVRSVHRCTSTPGLSTTSSLWDLTC